MMRRGADRPRILSSEPVRSARRCSMTRWVLFLTAVLFVATQAAAQQQPQPGMMPSPGGMPQMVALAIDGLLGAHINILVVVTELGRGAISIPSLFICLGQGDFFE